MMHMMNGSCGPVMMVIGALGGLLGLGLLGSLIVLTWVLIRSGLRCRQDPRHAFRAPRNS